MESHQKRIQIAQLTALARVKLEQAGQEKIYAGRISPEVVAEIYRIGHQILAVIQDEQLDMHDPNYLFGLYTALLKLHKQNRKNEESLYGRAETKTICEIARLEHLLEQLRQDQQHTGAEPEVQELDLLAIRAGLKLLLS